LQPAGRKKRYVFFFLQPAGRKKRCVFFFLQPTGRKKRCVFKLFKTFLTPTQNGKIYSFSI
jgi:hypothetical protein